MKILITSLFLLQSLSVVAQSDEDALPMMKPRILALDNPISVANRFNDEISKQAKGYTLAFTDKETPQTIRQVYKTESNETLKIEYKYAIDNDDEGSQTKPTITYQRISGDAGIITGIYNYLFNENLTADKLSAVSTRGTEIMYQGNTHQLILEPDDYAPGYWTLTFVR